MCSLYVRRNTHETNAVAWLNESKISRICGSSTALRMHDTTQLWARLAVSCLYSSAQQVPAQLRQVTRYFADQPISSRSQQLRRAPVRSHPHAQSQRSLREHQVC